jgi:hypothetical protein
MKEKFRLLSELRQFKVRNAVGSLAKIQTLSILTLAQRNSAAAHASLIEGI